MFKIRLRNTAEYERKLKAGYENKKRTRGCLRRTAFVKQITEAAVNFLKSNSATEARVSIKELNLLPIATTTEIIALNDLKACPRESRGSEEEEEKSPSDKKTYNKAFAGERLTTINLGFPTHTSFEIASYSPKADDVKGSNKKNSQPNSNVLDFS